jgi:hypothetical protein
VGVGALIALGSQPLKGTWALLVKAKIKNIRPSTDTKEVMSKYLI